MQTLNAYNLPQSFVNVLSRNKLPVKGRYSVTDLIGPPLPRILKMKHWDALTEDIADKLWMLLGSSVHYILEKGSPDNSLSEEKIETQKDGITIVGMSDLYHNKKLEDYKVTSIYSFLLGDKPEWENQLNLYAWIYRVALAFEVDGLNIHAILRDWVKSKAMNDPDYPPIPFQTIAVPLWESERAEHYVGERIALHRAAEEHGYAPCCTDEERWARPTTYAVVKKGNKRAARVLDNMDEAEQWAAINMKDKYNIQERPGEYTKCASYCLVREVCEYNPYRKGQAA
jgi:hypothetical protein